MKSSKIILCMILSVSIGIIASTPLLMAELNIRPWITHIQGPTVSFSSEVVYANFTITSPNTPITQTSGPTINYYVVINVTNPSEYRTILSWTELLVAQNVQSINDKTPLLGFFTIAGEGGEAKGAWVDDIYYNVTLTIPYPSFDSSGTMTQEEEVYGFDYQWIEGVQYYKYTVKEDQGINTYTYLNMNGTWVDVTGRVIIDETEPVYGPNYAATGGVINQNVYYLGSGSKASKDNEYNCFFAPCESRLLVISGSLDLRLPWVGSEDSINPVDIIQSGIVQMLTQIHSYVDIEPIGENNTFIDTWANTSNIQEISLTRIGNSYIYNTVLSDNQMFQLDQYGLEVFIVSME